MVFGQRLGYATTLVGLFQVCTELDRPLGRNAFKGGHKGYRGYIEICRVWALGFPKSRD